MCLSCIKKKKTSKCYKLYNTMACLYSFKLQKGIFINLEITRNIQKCLITPLFEINVA